MPTSQHPESGHRAVGAYSRDVTRPVAMTAAAAHQHVRDQVLSAVGLELDAYRGTMDDLNRAGFGSVTIRIAFKEGMVSEIAVEPLLHAKRRDRDWAALVARVQEEA